ncbi:MAG: hypothetical protein C0602_00995 [Denitrovibrio sp.]|nr:MAG: hypothetical protein C0602_00995 [Denitrovibrio sp.]
MKDVFVSGWYGYTELFSGLSEDFEFAVPFITHSLSDIDELMEEGGKNLFAWSTGAFLMLDRQKRPNFENIVLISPFKKFTSYTPERVLEIMIKKFVDFPEKVASDFIKRCGCEGTPEYNPQHFHILLHGLRFLLRTDVEELEWSLEGVKVLHGTEDKIVDVQASRDMVWETDATLYEIEGAGHWIKPDILSKYKI